VEGANKDGALVQPARKRRQIKQGIVGILMLFKVLVIKTLNYNRTPNPICPNVHLIDPNVHFYMLLRRPAMRETRNKIIKMKNRIFAMEAAPAAMPKKPKMPARMAMIRKMTAQRNIANDFSD
jgi:hypothetical protein